MCDTDTGCFLEGVHTGAGPRGPQGHQGRDPRYLVHPLAGMDNNVRQVSGQNHNHHKGPNRFALLFGDQICPDLNGRPAWLNVAVRAAAQEVPAAGGRLRSMRRHERMAVAMAVAEAMHHYSRGRKTATAIWGVEEPETGSALPSTKSSSTRERRPGIPAEPGPQRSDRRLRRSSGPSLPLLAAPSVAAAADGVAPVPRCRRARAEGGRGVRGGEVADRPD